jgi:hypothetical protein
VHDIQVEAGLAGVAAGVGAELLELELEVELEFEPEAELEGGDAAGVAGAGALLPPSVDEGGGVAVAPSPSGLPPSGLPLLDLP